MKIHVNSWNFVKFCRNSWNIFNFNKPFLFMIVHFLMKSSEIRIKSRNFREKSDRIKMIVLCEIGWPQKSPWVRMIWMISCSETIKINSKTWLRFYLIIKPNISFSTIFSFFAFIWFIFEIQSKWCRRDILEFVLLWVYLWRVVFVSQNCPVNRFTDETATSV